jgi:hypothetical protein
MAVWCRVVGRALYVVLLILTGSQYFFGHTVFFACMIMLNARYQGTVPRR